MVADFVITLLIGAGSFVVGAIYGRFTLQDRINLYKGQKQAAYYVAGKLSRIIGRQRRTIKKLKEELKTVSNTKPITAPANRPSLPH